MALLLLYEILLSCSYIFDVYTELIFSVENNKADLKVFKDTLKIKFLDRKLINLNGLTLVQFSMI